MKDNIKNIAVIVVGGLILLGIFIWTKPTDIFRQGGKKPETKKEDIKPATNTTGMPLELQDGFSIEIFAKDLAGARVMAFDGSGNLWLSQTSEGIIAKLDIQNNLAKTNVFTGLRRPHGLAFGANYDTLYIAEENRVSKVIINEGLFKHLNNTLIFRLVLEKIADLPAGGGHFTRTLGVHSEDKIDAPEQIYISIGSSCNVCKEPDQRRAAIYTMNPDGSDFKLFAKGLRNTVFFTWDENGKMWGTDMGRDNLGDDIPPDEINIIEEGKNYGWPICYGKQIHDDVYDNKFTDKCVTAPPHIDLQAHSAPLGLAFIPKGFGPKDWERDLIVAFHGSWNRSVPTGYKLVRIKFDSNGNYEGAEDFIIGWLQGRTVHGRPVDVVFYQGALYVSDDKAGVIYRVTYNGNE